MVSSIEACAAYLSRCSALAAIVKWCWVATCAIYPCLLDYLQGTRKQDPPAAGAQQQEQQADNTSSRAQQQQLEPMVASQVTCSSSSSTAVQHLQSQLTGRPPPVHGGSNCRNNRGGTALFWHLFLSSGRFKGHLRPRQQETFVYGLVAAIAISAAVPMLSHAAIYG